MAVNRMRDESSEDYFSWLQAIKEWENNLISGQTKMGKTLVWKFLSFFKVSKIDLVFFI
jgi:hypothetical protein